MNLETLVLELVADDSQLSRDIDSAVNKAMAKLSRIERVGAINPKVNAKALHDLNKLLDVKQKHIEETARVFNNTPIIVRVDSSAVAKAKGEVADLRGELSGMSATVKAEVTHKFEGQKESNNQVVGAIKSNTTQGQKIESAIEKSAKSMAGAVLKGNLLSSAVKNTVGVVGKGAKSVVDDMIAERFGSSELLGKKLTQAIVKSLGEDFNLLSKDIELIANKFGLDGVVNKAKEEFKDLSEAVSESIDGLLGDERILEKGKRAKSKQQKQQQLERQGREGALVDARDKYFEKERASQSVDSQKKEIDSLNSKAQLATSFLSNIDFTGLNESEVNQLNADIEVAESFLNGYQEQLEELQSNLKNAELLLKKRNKEFKKSFDDLKKVTPKSVNPVYIEAASAIFGSVDELKLPRVIRGRKEQKDAASYSAFSDAIELRDDLYAQYQTGQYSDDLMRVFLHELRHAKQTNQGSFKGFQQSLNQQGQILPSLAMPETKGEAKQMADFLKHYEGQSQYVLDNEVDAELIAQRELKKIKDAKNKQLNRTSSIAHFGMTGEKIGDKLGRSQIKTQIAKIEMLQKSMDSLGIDSFEALTKYKQLFEKYDKEIEGLQNIATDISIGKSNADATVIAELVAKKVDAFSQGLTAFNQAESQFINTIKKEQKRQKSMAPYTSALNNLTGKLDQGFNENDIKKLREVRKQAKAGMGALKKDGSIDIEDKSILMEQYKAIAKQAKIDKNLAVKTSDLSVRDAVSDPWGTAITTMEKASITVSDKAVELVHAFVDPLVETANNVMQLASQVANDPTKTLMSAGSAIVKGGNKGLRTIAPGISTAYGLASGAENALLSVLPYGHLAKKGLQVGAVTMGLPMAAATIPALAPVAGMLGAAGHMGGLAAGGLAAGHTASIASIPIIGGQIAGMLGSAATGLGTIVAEMGAAAIAVNAVSVGAKSIIGTALEPQTKQGIAALQPAQEKLAKSTQKKVSKLIEKAQNLDAYLPTLPANQRKLIGEYLPKAAGIERANQGDFIPQSVALPGLKQLKPAEFKQLDPVIQSTVQGDWEAQYKAAQKVTFEFLAKMRGTIDPLDRMKGDIGTISKTFRDLIERLEKQGKEFGFDVKKYKMDESAFKGVTLDADAVEMPDMSKLKRDAESVGKSIPDGINIGVNQNKKVVFETIDNTMGQTIDVSKKAIDSNSPSKKFIEIGQSIGQGLDIGASESLTKAEINIMQKLKALSDNPTKLFGVNSGNSLNLDTLKAVRQRVVSSSNNEIANNENLKLLSLIGKTNYNNLIRMHPGDANHLVGDKVNFSTPKSFTGDLASVLSGIGLNQGSVNLQKGDSLYRIKNPRKGFDIPYDAIGLGNDPDYDYKKEKESLVAGNYKVSGITKQTIFVDTKQGVDALTVSIYELEESTDRVFTKLSKKLQSAKFIDIGQNQPNQAIEQNWDKTKKAVQADMVEITKTAEDQAYPLQRNISEGSPGPTDWIRKNWKKTADFVNQQIDSITANSVKLFAQGKKSIDLPTIPLPVPQLTTQIKQKLAGDNKRVMPVIPLPVPQLTTELKQKLAQPTKKQFEQIADPWGISKYDVNNLPAIPPLNRPRLETKEQEANRIIDAQIKKTNELTSAIERKQKAQERANKLPVLPPLQDSERVNHFYELLSSDIENNPSNQSPKVENKIKSAQDKMADFTNRINANLEVASQAISEMGYDKIQSLIDEQSKSVDEIRRRQGKILADNSLTDSVKVELFEGLEDDINQLNQSIESQIDKILSSDSDSDNLFENLRSQFSIIDQLINRFDGLIGTIKRFGMLAVGGIGLALLAKGLFDVGKNALTAYKNLEGVFISAKLLKGSDRYIADLRKQALQLGSDLRSTLEQGIQFSSALVGTPLESMSQSMFKDASAALSYMGLQQQYDSALLALKQVASKGRVSLEEITGQLGESVPGIMPIVADALGTNVSGAIQQIESGNVLAEDLLPNLIAGMKNRTAGLAPIYERSLTASQGRLGTSIEELNVGIGERLAPAVIPAINAVSSAILVAAQNVDKLVESFKFLALGLAGQMIPGLLQLGGHLLIAAGNAAKAALNINLMTVATKAFTVIAKPLLLALAAISAYEILTFTFSEKGSQSTIDAIKEIDKTLELINPERDGDRTIKLDFISSDNGFLDFIDTIIRKLNSIPSLTDLFGGENAPEWIKNLPGENNSGDKGWGFFGKQKFDAETKRTNEFIQKNNLVNQESTQLGDPTQVNNYIAQLNEVDQQIAVIQGRMAALRLTDAQKNADQIKALQQSISGTLNKDGTMSGGLIQQRQAIEDSFIPGGLDKRKRDLESLKAELERISKIRADLDETTMAPEIKVYDDQIAELNKTISVSEAYIQQMDQAMKNLGNTLNAQRLSFINLSGAIAQTQENYAQGLSAQRTALTQLQMSNGLQEQVNQFEDLSFAVFEAEQNIKSLQQIMEAQKAYMNSNVIDTKSKANLELAAGKKLEDINTGDVTRLKLLIQNDNSLKAIVNDSMIGVLEEIAGSNAKITDAKKGLVEAQKQLAQFEISKQGYYRDTARQIYDLRVQIDGQRIQDQRSIEDLAIQFRDASRSLQISNRGLIDSYKDMGLDFNIQIATIQKSLADAKDQIKLSQLKAENLSITPGNSQSAAKQVNDIVLRFAESVFNTQTNERQVKIDILNLEKERIGRLRQIREFEERQQQAQIDYENQVRTLNRAKLDLERSLTKSAGDLARAFDDLVRSIKRADSTTPEGKRALGALMGIGRPTANVSVPQVAQYAIESGTGRVVNQRAYMGGLTQSDVNIPTVQTQSYVQRQVEPTYPLYNGSGVSGYYTANQLRQMNQSLPQQQKRFDTVNYQSGDRSILDDYMNANQGGGYISQPVQQTQSLNQSFATPNLVAKAGRAQLTANQAKALIATAKRIGIDPITLLTIMLFETAGTLNPAITNSIGATGLIQFMPQTAKGLGTSTAALRKMEFEQQLPWVEKYFKSRGFKPGMSDVQAYATVIGGNPRATTAMDSNGVNAIDGLQRMNASHRQDAMKLFQGTVGGYQSLQSSLNFGIPESIELGKTAQLLPSGQDIVNSLGNALEAITNPEPKDLSSLARQYTRQNKIFLDGQDLNKVANQLAANVYNDKTLQDAFNKLAQSKGFTVNVKVQPQPKQNTVTQSTNKPVNQSQPVVQSKPVTKAEAIEFYPTNPTSFDLKPVYINSPDVMGEINKELKGHPKVKLNGNAFDPNNLPAPVQQNTEPLKQQAAMVTDLNTQLQQMKAEGISLQLRVDFAQAYSDLKAFRIQLEDTFRQNQRTYFDQGLSINQLTRNAKGFLTIFEQADQSATDMFMQYENQKRQIFDQRLANQRLLENKEALKLSKEQAREAAIAKGLSVEQFDSEINLISAQVDQIANQNTILDAQEKQLDVNQKNAAATALNNTFLEKQLALVDGYVGKMAELSTAKYNLGGTLVNDGAILQARLMAATASKRAEREGKNNLNLQGEELAQYVAMAQEIADINLKQSFSEAVPFVKELGANLKEAVFQTNNFTEALTKTLDLIATTVFDQLVLKPFTNFLAQQSASLFGYGQQAIPEVKPASFLPSIINMAIPFIGAKADGLDQVMGKESAMTGRKPMLAVVNDGEAILSTLNGDAQKFQALKRSGNWDKIPNFANGSDRLFTQSRNYQGNWENLVNAGGANTSQSVNNSRTNTVNKFNQTYVINTPNADSFRKSQAQIQDEGARTYRRKMR